MNVLRFYEGHNGTLQSEVVFENFSNFSNIEVKIICTSNYIKVFPNYFLLNKLTRQTVKFLPENPDGEDNGIILFNEIFSNVKYRRIQKVYGLTFVNINMNHSRNNSNNKSLINASDMRKIRKDSRELIKFLKRKGKRLMKNKTLKKEKEKTKKVLRKISKATLNSLDEVKIKLDNFQRRSQFVARSLHGIAISNVNLLMDLINEKIEEREEEAEKKEKKLEKERKERKRKRKSGHCNETNNRMGISNEKLKILQFTMNLTTCIVYPLFIFLTVYVTYKIIHQRTIIGEDIHLAQHHPFEHTHDY